MTPGTDAKDEADLEMWKHAEREISDAYLRVRGLLKDYGALDTLPGGGDRYEKTEDAIKAVIAQAAALKAENQELRRIAKVNLNDRVRFKVRPRGEKMWREHYAFLEQHGQKIPPIPDEEQLWQLMHIFGPGMMMGFDPPIETEIEVRSFMSGIAVAAAPSPEREEKRDEPTR
jgi:hypothetical protein